MTEREDQKRRTKSDLLTGARTLLSQGRPVTVTAAAQEAGISKATAYRYYSDAALLAAEAGLAFRMAPYEQITRGAGTVREKLVAISVYYFDMALENETAFRTYLGLFLQASAQPREEPPVRGARRVEAFRRAIAQGDAALDPGKAEKLVAALCMGTGAEAMIGLVDIAGCSHAEARELVAETADAIIDRFLVS